MNQQDRMMSVAVGRGRRLVEMAVEISEAANTIDLNKNNDDFTEYNKQVENTIMDFGRQVMDFLSSHGTRLLDAAEKTLPKTDKKYKIGWPMEQFLSEEHIRHLLGCLQTIANRVSKNDTYNGKCNVFHVFLTYAESEFIKNNVDGVFMKEVGVGHKLGTGAAEYILGANQDAVDFEYSRV